MRGLAGYAMIGRRQAIIVVLLFGLFPMLNLVSAAIVGLVNLRKGWHEGLLVLLWSLLPAGLLWATGDTTPVFLMIGVAILANVLRVSESWSKVFIVITVLGVLLQLSLAWQTSYVAQVEAILTEAMATDPNLDLSALAEGSESTVEQFVELLLSFYGAYHMVVFAVCLMIARYWQASLYNPGGFRQEFHGLRLDPKFMIVLLGLIIAGTLDVAPLNSWVPLFCIVPIFAGMAVLHSVVAIRKLGPGWLVMGYMVLLMMAPIIILLAFVDSVVDIRKRIMKEEV